MEFHYVIWTLDPDTHNWVVHSGHDHIQTAEATALSEVSKGNTVRLTEEKVIGEWK